MGGKLFQYGTAAHLALLTAAPLFLFAVCGPATHAAVLAWLSLFAAMWVVMNPTPRAGEWPRDARHRIGWEIARDPFLILCAVALVLSAVRAVNAGIILDYDAGEGLWLLKGPRIGLLPGSVAGRGTLPLAGVLALAVVTLGVRHALGARARTFYLLATGTLAAGAVAFWKFLLARGAALPALAPSAEDPFSLGTLLGVYFIFALAVWVGSWSSDSAVLELFAAIVSAVILLGLLLFAPAFSVLAYAVAGLLVFAAGVCLEVLRRRPSARFITVVSLLIVLAPIALAVSGEIARPPLWPVFPDGFSAVRDSATSVALAAWKDSTRLGVGLGAFPLSLGFHATPEDWQILSSAQTAAPNGWVHFLFERGFLGAVMLLAGLGILLRDILLRYLRAGSGWSFAAPQAVGPLVLFAVAAVMFADCSYSQLEALAPVGAALALTAAALPESPEVNHG